MDLKCLNRQHSFGGWTEFYSHTSKSTASPMRFSVFVPPQAANRRVPVIYWLSGLTCTEETFMAKAGAQRTASELGVLLVAPDTSPRGLNLPGDSESWDFGVGAGFYVNATQAPWAGHYRMYDYVTEELPALIRSSFQVEPTRESIMGHSMGGHGALIAALRQPGRYASVSAFAPICAPSRCPWGLKAFSGYLGSDQQAWMAYDACALIAKATQKQELLVDQGLEDKFLKEQLLPDSLELACREKGFPLQMRRQANYDHSYYFISTFIDDHLRYHALRLR